MATTIKGLSITGGKLDVKLDAMHFQKGSDGEIQIKGWEALHSYGVEWDDNVADPDCVRIGNMDLHRTLPVQSLMRGCLLDDNGNVVMYLPEDDWTGSVRDGSMGQVMVEMPRHYRKFVTEGTKHQVWLSLYPIDGYHEVPKMYVGAYEAAVQRSTSKLCSVKNETADFRGGNNNSSYDGLDADLRGMAATNLSLTRCRQYARNRNQATAEWNCYTYECHKAITWLFVVEYATRNSQKAYNAQPTSEGYKQGGLGTGVTSIDGSKWDSYNGYHPFVPCAWSDSLGNKTGSYAIETRPGLGSVTTHIPRYRGIEHPFGHIWKWVDGVLCQGYTDSEGFKISLYLCDDPAKYNDTTDYHRYAGQVKTNSSYIQSMILGDKGEIIPADVSSNASSSTHWCDYYYTDSSAYTRGVLFGGGAHYGATAGLADSNADSAPSDAYTTVGSRLCFIPR